MTKKTLDQLSLDRLRAAPVLVRADLNVPLQGHRVADDTRIRASLPTLEGLLSLGARVVLLSHLGRPGGSPDPALSLEPVARRLGELLFAPVAFVGSVRGPEARAAVDDLYPGSVLLLENTRFLPGETEGDEALAAEWAEFGSVFVNDAFGTAHRAHASTAVLAKAVSRGGGVALAGRLMEKEMNFLDRLVHEPPRPFVAILGGAKISGKIDVLEGLLPRVDRLIVGGAMANTFFVALGLEVGESLVERDRAELALDTLRVGGERILLPVDCVVSDRIAEDSATRVAPRSELDSSDRIGDIGPESRDLFASELKGAGSVFWNGPMGVFELEPFREGTLAVARSVAAASTTGALTVVGGGDSAAAAAVAGVTDRVSHLSTGGGASLAFLAGVELPGIATLSDL